MKTQLSLQELANAIADRATRKEDFSVDTRKIELDGNFMVFGDQAVDMTDICHSQVAEHTKIPASYYNRMREEDLSLLSTNVGTWFKKHPAERMVRTFQEERPFGVQGTGTARAFLSSKYNRMDDDAFAEVVLPAVFDIPGVEVVSCGMTDAKTTIKVKSEKFTRNVKVGDDVQFGIAFGNSEVGLGRLSGSLFCYRLQCLNGMVIEDEMFAATHVGGRFKRDLGEIFKLDTIKADSQATILKLRDFAKEILTPAYIDGQVRKMQGLTEMTIKDPIMAIERLSKKNAFTEVQQKSILEHLIKGGDLTMWGLTNAVTRTAEDQDGYDEATRLETVGGRMLALSKADYGELLAAA